MANAIEILINAKDNASGVLQRNALTLESLAASALASVAAFASVGAALQAITSAGIGASREFASEVEQLDRLRYVTGLSTEQLQIFRRGLERNGLAADQLGLSLRFLQNQLAGGNADLAAVGVTSRNTFVALQQLGQAMRAAATETDRTELAAKALGLRNVEVAQTIIDVAANYKNDYADAASAGAVMTGRFEDKMRDLDGALDDFSDTVRSLKIELADLFAAPFAGAVKLLNFLNEHKDFFKTLTPAPLAFLTSVVASLTAPKPGTAGIDPATGGPRGGVPSPERNPFAPPPNPAAILSGYTFSTGNENVAFRDLKTEPLVNLLKVLRESETPVQRVQESYVRLQQTMADFAMGAQQAMSYALTSVLTGVQSLGAAFRQLIMNIFQSIAEAISRYLAQQAAGWLLSGIGYLVGGPAGAAIGKVGGAIRGSAMSPAGGNTFVIQSISSKDALESLVAPTGSLRRANDRIYEVAMAGAL